MAVVAGVRAVGLCVVACVAYAIFGTALLQGHAQRSLNPATHIRISAVDIGLDEMVLGNDSRSALESGPALVTGSGRPGASTPIVIAGHRIANGGPFRHLGALRPGRQVLLRDGANPALTYVVERTVTAPLHGLVTESAGRQVLVLETSTPAYRPSHTFAVIARLTGGPPGGSMSSSRTFRLAGLGSSAATLLAAFLLLAGLGVGWAWRAGARSRLSTVASVATRISAISTAYVIWRLVLLGAPTLL